MQTFKSMTTVIKFANLTLESGNVEEAHQGYHDALVLFTKLNNDRGVSCAGTAPVPKLVLIPGKVRFS